RDFARGGAAAYRVAAAASARQENHGNDRDLAQRRARGDRKAIERREGEGRRRGAHLSNRGLQRERDLPAGACATAGTIFVSRRDEADRCRGVVWGFAARAGGAVRGNRQTERAGFPAERREFRSDERTGESDDES